MGILVLKNVSNPVQHEELDRRKLELENELKGNFTGLNKADLKNIEPLKAYSNYYKKFRKTYHVLLQLDSIINKNRSIPKVAALVEAMFMAELKNQLLTAGHELDAIDLPIKLEASNGGEKYIQISGQEKELIREDMMVTDSKGIMSCIIYGPDQRTRIKPDTRNVLFVVYAPPGVEKSKVKQHLQDIQNYIHIIVPESESELLRVYD